MSDQKPKSGAAEPSRQSPTRPHRRKIPGVHMRRCCRMSASSDFLGSCLAISALVIKNEAVSYAAGAIAIWREAPGALEWLSSNLSDVG
jgi:hypothetical protein